MLFKRCSMVFKETYQLVMQQLLLQTNILENINSNFYTGLVFLNLTKASHTVEQPERGLEIL